MKFKTGPITKKDAVRWLKELDKADARYQRILAKPSNALVIDIANEQLANNARMRARLEPIANGTAAVPDGSDSSE